METFDLDNRPSLIFVWKIVCFPEKRIYYTQAWGMDMQRIQLSDDKALYTLHCSNFFQSSEEFRLQIDVARQMRGLFSSMSLPS